MTYVSHVDKRELNVNLAGWFMTFFLLVGGVSSWTHQIVADFQQISARCQSFQFNKRVFPSSLVFEEVEIDANPPARRRASRVLNFQMQLKA